MSTNETEERILTLECIMAELGYKTVRNTLTDSVQIIVGEIRIIADDVELVLQSENHPDWGYVANLLKNGDFVASVNRWVWFD